MITFEPTVFTEIVGDTAEMRIMDFMLCEGRLFDYPMTEIARNSHVSWTTFNEIWPTFIKRGIVTQTRRIGRARLYKLDESSPMVKALVCFWKKISLLAMEQETQKTKVAVPA